MKTLLKIVACSCLMFAAVPGFAQMMPDSTVQICAYWQPGDRYSYRCEETKYQVDEKNDTTVLESRSEIRTFEVLAQTKDAYRLSLSYSGFQSSDEEEMMINKTMEDAVGQYVIEFETNEFGTLQRFTNLYDIAARMIPAVDVVIEKMYSDNKDMKKVIPKKKMRDYMIDNTCTPEAIMTAVLDDIGRLFFFHGARLDTVSTYTMDEKFAPIVAAADSIDCKTNFWADARYTDEYSAVCRTYSEPADEKALASFMSSFVTGVVSGLLPMNKKTKGQMDELTEEMADKMTATFEQYTTEEIHLETGWFINYYYDRFVKVSTDRESKEIIWSRSVQLMD